MSAFMEEPFYIFDEPAELKRLSEMIFVEGGTFSMGDNEDEKKNHLVKLDSFRIGKYPVTVQQYLQFTDETKTHYPEWLEKGSQYNVQTGNDDHYRKLGDALQNPTNPIMGIS